MLVWLLCKSENDHYSLVWCICDFNYYCVPVPLHTCNNYHVLCLFHFEKGVYLQDLSCVFNIATIEHRVQPPNWSTIERTKRSEVSGSCMPNGSVVPPIAYCNLHCTTTHKFRKDSTERCIAVMNNVLCI